LFSRFPTYVLLIQQRYRETDDMQSQYRDLHYSASRGKNEPTKIRCVELVYGAGLLVCGVNYKLKQN